MSELGPNPHEYQRPQKIVRGLVASLAILGASCSSDKQPTPEDAELAALANLIQDPKISQRHVYDQDTLKVDSHTLTVSYLDKGLANKHRPIIKALLPNYPKLPGLVSKFNISNPTTGLQAYQPGLAPYRQHTLLIMPEGSYTFASKSATAVTKTPVIAPALQDQTVSILPEYEPAGNNPLERQLQTYPSSIATELCQSLIAVEPVNISPASPNYIQARTSGQEVYCISIGATTSAVLAKMPYTTYTDVMAHSTFDLGSIRAGLIAVSQPAYESLSTSLQPFITKSE
jgi:hypothetical protein